MIDDDFDKFRILESYLSRREKYKVFSIKRFINED
jgi:hypothetical protein